MRTTSTTAFLFAVGTSITGWIAFGICFYGTKFSNNVIPLSNSETVLNPGPPLDPYLTTTWFDRYFQNYPLDGLGLHRWKNYFYPFERHLGRWKGRPVVLLEIGVQSGGSTNMWREYFGEGLDYYGFDINPSCKTFERENVTIIIGNQSNAEDLTRLRNLIPLPDIIIDDGGHFMDQQQVSFAVLFPVLESGGLYLIEDVHTSYSSAYGGHPHLKHFRSRNSTIALAKSLVDVIHMEDIKGGMEDLETAQKLHDTIGGVFFYNKMIFIEKTRMRPNKAWKVGGKWIAYK